MKYLVTSERNTFPLPSPKQWVGLVQASQKWLKEKLANGTLDCFYVFCNCRSSVSIVNAESHEQVLDLLLSSSLYAFYDWDIKPLCEWNHSFDSVIELFKKLSS